MKKIRVKKIITILSLTVFFFFPLMAFGGDMWSETPDLFNDFETPSVVSEPVKFKYTSPAIDMWAKTPDLFDVKEDHGVVINSESKFVSNFNPEMYAETPDLKIASDTELHRDDTKILLADE